MGAAAARPVCIIRRAECIVLSSPPPPPPLRRVAHEAVMNVRYSAVRATVVCVYRSANQLRAELVSHHQ